jgi:hypothetical protein
MPGNNKTVLEQALKIVGNKKELCKVLWISDEELEAYLSGKRRVPQSVVTAATDVIAARSKRR